MRSCTGRFLVLCAVAAAAAACSVTPAGFTPSTCADRATCAPMCGNGRLETGEQCDDGNTSDGDACEADCTLPACGNGIVDRDEQCDDGNASNGDACDVNCTPPGCGNGIVDPGEQCDDGDASGEPCDANCTLPGCGNGVVDPGEQCDDGNTVNGDACDVNCMPPACGNGILDALREEQCDDGNAVNGDACEADCTVPFCGNAIVDPDEQCDDGNTTDGDSCETNCTRPACGNGILDRGEQCDDGNLVSGDTCETDCTVPFCGNAIVDRGEQCDDGNAINGDACETDCTAPICGNAIVDPGEQCDDGNPVNGDTCDVNCTPPGCGNAIVDPGEQCDDGNPVNGDTCDVNCTPPICGNAIIDPGESCDDGNRVNGDACDVNCTPPGCGNAIVDPGESCDDGNRVNGDTCEADCTLPACGNGIVDPGESCDDGNRTNADTCEADCTLPVCGNHIVDPDEDCDDGNTASGDGCDALCLAEPFRTTAPVKISGELSCTTAVANAARKIAVDGSGTLYAVMTCGATARVVVSTDRGATYSLPRDVSADVLAADPPGASEIVQVAVASGPSRVAYLAFMRNDNQVYLRTTEDAGATWSAPVPVGTAFDPTAGLSLQSFNDDLYVGYRSGDGVTVARNHHRGSGGFEMTDVQMGIAFFDLAFDARLGTLAVCTDTPLFHIRASSDAGASFGPEVNPPGQEYYSDWAIANGTIFVAGTRLDDSGSETLLYRISTGDLSSSTSVAGLPSVGASQTRSIAADEQGNVFVASQLDVADVEPDIGGVQLDRLAFGASAFAAPRILSRTGGSPIAAPLPGSQGVAVVFSDRGAVYATIQAYETSAPTVRAVPAHR